MPGFNIIGSEFRSANASIETRRKHRWIFTVTKAPQNLNAELKDITIYALKVDRPKPIIDKIPVHHGQDVIYIPGKNKWDPIDVTFYEVDNPDSAKMLYSWLWTVVNFSQSALNKDFRSEAIIEMTDGSGFTKWLATLKNAWPVQINMESLDYSSSEIAKTTVTVSYDKADMSHLSFLE